MTEHDPIGGDRAAKPLAQTMTAAPSPGAINAPIALEPIDDLATRNPRRYEPVGEPKCGGNGRVTAALDRQLGRVVAVKELVDELSSAAHERFIREATITARLEHPSIIPVHDAGRWPNGSPFYTMKRVSGQSLREAIEETKRLEDRLALLPRLIAVAEAVAYAHNERVIHRDLKPSNVMVSGYGETLVIDWGIAKDLSTATEQDDESGAPYRVAAGGDLTRTGTVIGTPAYMPPEQARGEDVDERADVYALGAMIHHTLAGVPPYQGTSSKAVLEDVLTRPPTSLRDLVPELPEELIAIVEKAMARDAGDRYASAKELAEDLRRFQTGQFVGAHRYTAWQILRRWIAQHRTVVTVATVMAAALVAVAVFSFRRVVRERDRAEAAQRRAEEESRRSTASRNEMIIANAQGWLNTDPTQSVAWLKEYPVDGADVAALRRAAADAVARGVARDLSPRTGRPIRFLSFSDDGSQLVSADKEGQLLLWRATSGFRRVPTDAAYILTAHWVSGGIITGGDGTIRLVDPTQGTTQSLLTHEPFTFPSISPSKRTYAAPQSDGSIALLDLVSGDVEIVPVAGVTGMNAKVVQFLDEERIAAMYLDVPVAVVVDLSTRKQITLRGHDGPIREVLALPGTNVLVTCSADTTIRTWSYPDGKPLRVLRGHTKPVWDIDVSADGKLIASGSDDGTVRLWAPDGESTRVFTAHQHEVPMVAFSPDGNWLAAVDYDGGTWLWDVQGEGHRPLLGNAGHVYFVAFSPSGGLVATGGSEGQVRIWDVPQARVRRAHSAPVYEVAFADAGALFAGSIDGHLTFWDRDENLIASGRTIRNERVLRIYPASGVEAAVVLTDRSLLHWRPRSGELESMRVPSDARIMGHVDPTGTYAVAVERDAPGRVLVLDMQQDRWTEFGIAPGQQVRNLRALADGTFILVSGDGEVTVWNRAEPGSYETLTKHGDIVRSLADSSSGSTIATGDMAGRISVCELRVQRCRDHQMPAGVVRIVLTGDDGELVLGDYDGGVWTLNWRTGARSLIGQVPAGPAEVLSLSDDGSIVAAAATVDGGVHIFETSGGVALTLRGHSAGVVDVRFSGDGKYLVSGSKDGTIRGWAISELPLPPHDSHEIHQWLAHHSTARLREEP